MRFAYVAALTALAFAGTAVVIACSDDPATAPGASSSSSSGSSSGTSSTSSSGSSGTQGDDDDGSEPDGGPKTAPDGCILYSTDMLKGGAAASVPRDGIAGGGVAWTAPTAALSEDGAFSVVTLEEGQESAWLALTDFKIDLPDDKATWGIIVQLKRQSVDSGILDARLDLTLDTDPPPTPKRFDPPWPRLIVGTHHYGAQVDTWRTNLFPKNVRRVEFGPRLAAKRMPGVTGPVTAKVDSLKVQVWYCNADKK